MSFPQYVGNDEWSVLGSGSGDNDVGSRPSRRLQRRGGLTLIVELRVLVVKQDFSGRQGVAAGYDHPLPGLLELERWNGVARVQIERLQDNSVQG